MEDYIEVKYSELNGNPIVVLNSGNKSVILSVTEARHLALEILSIAEKAVLMNKFDSNLSVVMAKVEKQQIMSLLEKAIEYER